MEKYTIKHFIPKKSNVEGKVPTTASTVEGELSVNTADDKIFLHNSGNKEITFSSDAYNDERFVNASGDTVNGKLGIADTLSVSGNAIFSSGITMPYLGDTVVLQDLISGNSYVTSQALNDLNQRMLEYLPLSGGTMTNGIKYSQDETYKRVYNADGSTNYIGTYASFLQPNNLFRNIVTRNEWINVYSGDDIMLYTPVVYQADPRQWSYAPPIGSYIGGSYTLSFSIPNDGLSYDPSMIFEIYGGASETIVEIGKDAEYYMNNYASSLQLQCSGDITTAKIYVKEKDKQKGVLYKSHHSDNRYTITFDENPSDTHVLIFRWKAKDRYTSGGLDSPIFVQGDIDVKASNNMSLLLEGEITRKQDKLVSGTNIKTINGVSLLGDGNIDVSGGTGVSVTSVNGKTGIVILTADDLKAAQLNGQNMFTLDNTFTDTTSFEGDVDFSAPTLFRYGATFYSGLALSDGISQGNTIHVKNSGLSSNTDASDTIVWNTNGGKTNLSAYTLQSVYSKFSANVGKEILTLENEISEKQDELVSGVNIKTINNQSLLGQGNIDISGGASITVDSELSTSSTNPVQNKVITANVPTLNGKNTFTGSNTLTDGQHLSVVNDCSSITIDDGNSNWITLTAEGIKLDDDDDTGLVTTLGQSGLTISGETSSVGIDSTLTESKIAFNDYSKTGGYETDSYLSSSELYIENHTEQHSKLTPNNLELWDSIEGQKTNLGYSGLTLFDGITDNGKKIVITDKVSDINDGKNTVVIDNDGIYLPSGTSKLQTYLKADKLSIDDKTGSSYASLDANELYFESNGSIRVSSALYLKQGSNTYKFDFDKAVSLGLLVKQS
jgi:hypothetical protein